MGLHQVIQFIVAEVFSFMDKELARLIQSCIVHMVSTIKIKYPNHYKPSIVHPTCAGISTGVASKIMRIPYLDAR
jgi:hypothetical protein